MSIARTSLAFLVSSCAALSACKSDDSGGDDVQGTDSTGTASTGNTNPTSGPNPTSAASVDSTGSVDTTEPTSGGQTSMNPDSTGASGDVVAFRFTSIYVRDPHFFAGNGLACLDITDNDVAVIGITSVNNQFNAAIANDNSDPADGVLDLSLLLLFRPLDQADGAGGNFDFANGSCLIPEGATVCDLLDGTELYSSSYASQASGSCQAPVPGELSSANYNPQPGSTDGPCFLAGPSDVVIATSFANLPLSMATVAAQYVGDPADGLVAGTLHGFIDTATADGVTLPEEFQQYVQVLSDLLPGGEGCCQDGYSDKDGDGWWFYADFEATVVPWNGG